MREYIYRYFKFEEHDAVLSHEIMSGLTIFLSMSYILLTVPNTMAILFPEDMQDGMLIILTVATCLASAIGTLMLGIYARVPYAMAPSFSVSLFFTHIMCIQYGYSYKTALSIVLISGIIFFMLTVVGWRKIIVDAIPDNFKYAITAGIGFFISFVGLQKSKIIITSKYTMTSLNRFSSAPASDIKTIVLTIIGVITVAVLMKKRVRGALFIGKIVCVIIAAVLGAITIDKVKIFTDFSTLTNFSEFIDFSEIQRQFSLSGAGFFAFVSMILNITFMDIFDSIGTVIGTVDSMNNLDENIKKRKLDRTMETDAMGTIIGACVGVPNVSIYAESLVGIADGGKTGFSAVVCGIMFLLSGFIAPVIKFMPPAATACTLIIVGGFMMDKIVNINFKDIPEAIASIFIIVLMPLTFSIATGVAFGIIFYTLINLFSGHYRDISPTLYVLTVVLAVIIIM